MSILCEGRPDKEIDLGGNVAQAIVWLRDLYGTIWQVLGIGQYIVDELMWKFLWLVVVIFEKNM